jgi:hypothetical protein
MFEMGFRNGFKPMIGQGEEQEWGSLQPSPSWDLEQNPPSVPTYPTQTPIQTPTKPAGTSDSDWAKLIATGLTSVAAGYGAYEKEKVAEINAQAAKAAASSSASRFAPGGVGVGGVSANTMFLVGGIAVVGIIAAIALK